MGVFSQPIRLFRSVRQPMAMAFSRLICRISRCLRSGSSWMRQGSPTLKGNAVSSLTLVGT